MTGDEIGKPLMLIFPFDQLAHYLRCLTMANNLKPYFNIQFAASEKYNSFIKEEGFSVFPCKSLKSAEVMAKVRKFDFSWINEQSLTEVLTDQIRVIAEYRPHVILGDTSLTLKMAGEKTGTYYISLMNGYMSKYYSPGRKLPTSHPLFEYLKLLPGSALSYLTPVGERARFYEIHKPFKSLRKYHDLQKLRYYTDELEGDLNLLCDLKELFPQKALPANYQWLPPLFYDSDTCSGLDLKDRIDPEKKTIFVSMGSTGDWHKMCFLNDDHFKRYNIIVAGDAENVLTGSHCIKTGFVNAREVFPFTDLVFCHGGNGTTYQALQHGIPLFCITNHFEQEWNVHELEKAGLAMVLNGKSKTEIKALLSEWIVKERVRQQEFKEKMHLAGIGFESAIKKIVQYIFPGSIQLTEELKLPVIMTRAASVNT